MFRHLTRCAVLACLTGCAAGPATTDAGVPADAGEVAPPRCVDGAPVFPDGTFDDVPDFSLPGLDVAGAGATVAIRDHYDPCAARSTLLVLRFLAPWCGPCRWDLAHSGELQAGELEGRVRVIDLVVGDGQNAEPTLDTLRLLRDLGDVPATSALATIDLLAGVNTTRSPLPFLLVLDSRTLQRRYRGGNASPDLLVDRLRAELATLDGRTPPEPRDPVLTDELFNRKAWSLIQQMRHVPAPPADPSNAVAELPAARSLGRTLFNDTSLSPSGTVACVTCHDPTKGFADGLPTSLGAATGSRNSPSVALAAHARWQFWDGRAESLWAQALGPLENPLEFASDRTFVARAVTTNHAEAYAAAFGEVPDLSDTTRFPAHAKPGTAAWDGMAEGDRATITGIFVNVGKAIAAFERSLRMKPNRLDAYIDGDLTALNDLEKHGLSMFMSAGCIQCHHGPRLTDDAFHTVRFPTGRADGAGDRGRVDGLGLLRVSEFSIDGPWSDTPRIPHTLPADSPRMLGAFKTPSLRGVTHTAPYGHGGQLATLAEVLNLYSGGGLPPNDARAAGRVEPWLSRFALSHAAELEAFLRVLEARPEE